MQKLRLLFLLLFSPILLLAQQETRTKIFLERADLANGDAKKSITYLKNPTFRHENAILTCDSAVLYGERNYFEAFKNVRINQGDTLNIYSDFLNYDGNAKKAHLNKNVKLVDRTNTLTTNILDYDMVAKIGEYKEGGKLVTPDATITSKTGYYFSNSRDAYFKIDVLVVSAESTITSEDLRYNTLSNWTYFYGPTNIKGKDDNLYTENGAYNTKNENAYFGKKNLYTNGSKSLKGDSLYYYGKRGYGRAVKNIVFIDTKDHTLLRGQLGEYYKADERVVVTKNAYFGLGTNDSIVVNNKKIPDTLWMGADTLESQRVLVKNLSLLVKPVVQKDNEIGAEEAKAKAEKEKEKAEARKQLQLENKQSKAQEVQNGSKPTPKLSRKERKKAEKEGKLPGATETLPLKLPDSTALKKDNLLTDSIKRDSLLHLAKTTIANKKDSIKIDKKTIRTVNDKNGKKVGQTTAPTLTKKTNVSIKDSVVLNPADTVRARVIKAYHQVRVYKSNMQAKADSLFYTAADSTLRWYKNPILWSNGTQQTGDTINVFFKNNKVHTVQVLNNAFIVNVETDSTKFNQVKGKHITGFFNDGELRNMYVDGNAESIYYSKNNKGEYDNLNQTVSSRIRFRFDNKELTDIITIREIEGAVTPMDKLPKESLLTGFIWKPELRPTSKADIIKGLPIIKAATKPVAKPTTPKTGSGNNNLNKKDSPKPIISKPVAKPLPIENKAKPTDSVRVDTLIKQR